MQSLSRREFLGLGLAGAAGMMLRHPLMSLLGQAEAAAGECNVLFLPVDDLRPTIGCYGAPIDRKSVV